MHAEDQEPRFERRSASADAAALRLSEREPSGDEEAATPEAEEPEREGRARPSASAEAAALRWREEHPDD